MQISFFVEFPKTDLEGLKYLSWPTKLYITARNLEEFNNLKKKFKNKYVKEFIYWPALSKKEGYWISPFSKKEGLRRIFQELENKKVPVMIDAELPTTQNPLLYITQLFNFFGNRRLIRSFIKDYKDINVAEYYPQGKLMNSVLKVLGLHFDPKIYGCRSIKMVYHSMHKFKKEFITKELEEGVKRFGKNYLVAYGVMYHGNSWENKITSQQLKTDLEIAQKTKIEEIIIFRLAGLNKTFSSLIKKYSIEKIQPKNIYTNCSY
ncbi:MAG: hypothetical protein KKA62_06235 [Nanoarchaeota archaeon]|nr:hypothetical protein [Nanoarchaeota archaeon]MBU1644172.1 hypothetical protein [Nanoarchaeota archaeon]MBU1977523.1 hypothetical protein [Nanoarchaeota archaeon]